MKTIICTAKGHGYNQPLLINIISANDDPIVAQAGFSEAPNVLVTPLGSGVRPTSYDSFAWLGETTLPTLFPDSAMKAIHDWIVANVDSLGTGQVIPFELDGDQWVVGEGENVVEWMAV